MMSDGMPKEQKLEQIAKLPSSCTYRQQCFIMYRRVFSSIKGGVHVERISQ